MLTADQDGWPMQVDCPGQCLGLTLPEQGSACPDANRLQVLGEDFLNGLWATRTYISPLTIGNHPGGQLGRQAFVPARINFGIVGTVLEVEDQLRVVHPPRPMSWGRDPVALTGALDVWVAWSKIDSSKLPEKMAVVWLVRASRRFSNISTILAKHVWKYRKNTKLFLFACWRARTPESALCLWSTCRGIRFSFQMGFEPLGHAFRHWLQLQLIQNGPTF